MSKSLLLTGATGFVGRNLLLRCLHAKRYQRIVVLVRNVEKFRAQMQSEGYSELPATLEVDDFSFKKHHEVDHVIHCAGSLFSRFRADYQIANVEGTRKLLASLVGSPRVVLMSSQSAGGPTPIGKRKRSESTPDAPLTEYGRSKRDMEQLALREFGSHFSLILRAPMILGPRDQATRPLFDMARSRIRFKPGWRSKTYSWIAVEDLVDAIFSTLDATQEQWDGRQRIYYVAAPTPLTDVSLIAGAVEAVKGRMGVMVRLPQPVMRVFSCIVDWTPALRNRLPSLTRDRARELWPWRWVVDSARFQNRFHWQASRNLIETLKATVGK